MLGSRRFERLAALFREVTLEEAVLGEMAGAKDH